MVPSAPGEESVCEVWDQDVGDSDLVKPGTSRFGPFSSITVLVDGYIINRSRVGWKSL